MLATLLCVSVVGPTSAQDNATVSSHPLKYINTSFENASPLYWEIDDQGVVHIFLVYDQERVVAKPSQWTLALSITGPRCL